MPPQKDSLKDRLSRFRQINLTVTGRKSGRTISNPVWFVFEEGTLYLLPVRGSDTQWYKNIVHNPAIRIAARGAESALKATTVSSRAEVSSVVEKFRLKYGAGDIKRYYSKFDAAAIARVR